MLEYIQRYGILGGCQMEYFKYQQEGDCGRVWSLFSSLSSEMESPGVKKNGKGYPMYVTYAHPLEIVKPA